MTAETTGKVRRGDLTRRVILDAAAAEFADKGFDGASMRLIARNVGLEIGHIQHHFKTKKILWDATITDVLSGLVRDWEQIQRRSADMPPEAAVAAVVRLLVEFATTHPNFVSLMTRTRPAASPLATPFHTTLDQGTRATIRWIEQCQANGTFVRGNPAMLLSQLIGAALRIFSALDMSLYLGRSPFDPEVVEVQIKTCLSVFMPGYGGAAPEARWD